jgi:hypothetical protein
VRPSPAALVALAVTLAAASPWPSDWDGVGFSLALHDFSLPRWQPHAPGYPVFVLAARAVDLVAHRAPWSCAAVSALGASLLVAALARWRSLGAWSLALLASPVLAYVATQARSDALGLGLVALAVALGHDAVTPRARSLAAVLAALALGARPGLAVLVATCALAALGAWRTSPRSLVAALGSFAAVSALWGAWLVRASGGLARYRDALAEQALGHFREWGGSAWTEPDPAHRLAAFARSLGLGLAVDATLLGGLRGLAWALFAVAGARSLGRRAVGSLAALLAPCALTTYWTQNIAREPRHTLPVALALVAVAAFGMRALATTRARSVVVAGVCALLALPALETLWVGRTQRPPAVALGDFVRAQPDALLLAGRSARVASWRGAAALPCATLGDVHVTLARLPRLPARVFVSDEVAGLGRPTTRRFCRAAPWRGADACVAVSEIATGRGAR